MQSPLQSNSISSYYPEQIISTPRRWNSSPYLPHSSEHNTSPKTKKALTVTQRSRSLTNLSQEYPHDREKNEHRKGKGCRGYHLQGRRQDTDQETEAVVQKCSVNTPAPLTAMPRQASRTSGGRTYSNYSVGSAVLHETSDMHLMAMPRQASRTSGRRIYSNYSVGSAVLHETSDMQAAFAYQKVQVDLLLSIIIISIILLNQVL